MCTRNQEIHRKATYIRWLLNTATRCSTLSVSVLLFANVWQRFTLTALPWRLASGLNCLTASCSRIYDTAVAIFGLLEWKFAGNESATQRNWMTRNQTRQPIGRWDPSVHSWNAVRLKRQRNEIKKIYIEEPQNANIKVHATVSNSSRNFFSKVIVEYTYARKRQTFCVNLRLFLQETITYFVSSRVNVGAPKVAEGTSRRSTSFQFCVMLFNLYLIVWALTNEKNTERCLSTESVLEHLLKATPAASLQCLPT